MKKQNERGALIVEASIVFPVMFLIIFFMIFAGNAYLQKSRIEAITNHYAIMGAAYCADPQLSHVEDGKLPSVSELNVQPYRLFSFDGAGDIAGKVETLIDQSIKSMGTGLFRGMEPQDIKISADYSAGFLYSTFSVDVSYNIAIPIRLLGMDDFILYRVSSHTQMPVTDSVELIRNIDMVWDYMERLGLDEKVNGIRGKIDEVMGNVDKWFSNGKEK